MYHTPVIPSIRVRNFTRKTNQQRHALAPPQEFLFFPFAAKVFHPFQGKRLTTVTFLRKFFCPSPAENSFVSSPFLRKVLFLSPRHSKIFSFVPPSRGEGGIQGGWAGKCKRSIFVSSTLSRTACDPPCPFGHPPLTLVLRGRKLPRSPKRCKRKERLQNMQTLRVWKGGNNLSFRAVRPSTLGGEGVRHADSPCGASAYVRTEKLPYQGQFRDRGGATPWRR